MASVKLETFLYEARTNEVGSFSVPHVLEEFSPDGYQIVGIIVSVQHQNGNWHTLEISNAVDNRFWWNHIAVQGRITSRDFHDRPVRIIVFARPVE